MVSERKLAANRANALKSTGPRTPEGKAISSQNAHRLGMLAKSVVLRCEDPERFCRFAEKFHDEYNPRSATEIALVNTMATARWRLIRMSGVEAAGIDLEYVKQVEPAIVPADYGAPERAAQAYSSCARNTRMLDVVSRFESRLHRQFDSALARLMKLRTIRGATQEERPQSGPEIEDRGSRDSM